MTYSARSAYQSADSARGYQQRPVYSGLFGALRNRVERDAIRHVVERVEPGSVVLDCPCGNGRWFVMLARRASRIVARDISTGMIAAAGERHPGVVVDAAIGDAEKLDLADDAVDTTFSFALMKHLPLPHQQAVLREFARVSRRGVICSFAVFKPVSRWWWQRGHPAESYPVTRAEIEAMASEAGLVLRELVKVSQPVIGLEHFAVLDRAS